MVFQLWTSCTPCRNAFTYATQSMAFWLPVLILMNDFRSIMPFVQKSAPRQRTFQRSHATISNSIVAIIGTKHKVLFFECSWKWMKTKHPFHHCFFKNLSFHFLILTNYDRRFVHQINIFVLFNLIGMLPFH